MGVDRVANYVIASRLVGLMPYSSIRWMIRSVNTIVLPEPTTDRTQPLDHLCEKLPLTVVDLIVSLSRLHLLPKIEERPI
jgi:hypothetical protein